MDTIVCRRCGYAGPADARYCARCGRALVPLHVRSTGTLQRWLDNLAPRYVGLLGFLVLLPVSALVNHLLVKVGLYFPLSFFLFACVTGSACAYLGWQWQTPSSPRNRIIRILLVFAGLSLSLLAILWLDRAFLSAWVDNGRTVVSDIPGVHLEASAGARRLLVISSPPPYGLFALIFALLFAVAGNLARRVHLALVVREKQVRDLRQSLLVQTRDAAIQQERNRLARELHDSIKQQVFGINISAAAAQARWESDPQGAQEALGDVRRSAQEVMVEMNALLQQLSPVPLEKVGLRQALRDQCEALGYRTGAEVVAEFGDLPDDDRLPPGAQESLFRIAQEALSNVARHARAGHVRLYLGQRGSKAPLVLEIQDDGQGFGVDLDHTGMGLDNVRQRVHALGGTLEIDSSPGAGTTLRASLPLLRPAAPRPEDLQPHPPDHTLNKTILVGLGGGLALIAVLFYPLYVLLPGRYVAGWSTGPGALGAFLGIVAVFLVATTGLLAARWAGAGTRPGGTLFGALAGGVAGAIAYVGLGAAAAAVAGNAPLLRHGLALATSDAVAVRLLSEALIGVTWGVYGTFWVALLAGLGLGAIGGLLAPQSGVAPARPDPRLLGISILSATALVSALTLCASLLVFSLLEAAIQRATAEYALVLRTTLPLVGSSLWPTGSPLVLYLGSLAVLYALLRTEARSAGLARLGAVLPRAIAFSLLALALPLYVWFVAQDPTELTPALRAVSVLIAAGSLTLGGLYLALSVEVHRRRQALGLDRSSPIRIAAVLAVLLSLAALAWAASRSTPLSLVIASLVIASSIALMVILWRQPKPPAATAADLARGQASLVQTISTGLGLVIAIVLPLMPFLSIVANGLSITLQFPSALFSTNVNGQLILPGYTLADLVRRAYSTQATAVLLAFVGASAIVGLLLALISGRMAWTRWRVPQDAEAGEGA